MRPAQNPMTTPIATARVNLAFRRDHGSVEKRGTFRIAITAAATAPAA